MRKKWKILILAVACGMILTYGTFSLAADSAVDVSGAWAGMTEMKDGSVLATDTYHKVIWKLQDGKGTVFSGESGVEGLYGEPVGGYRDDTLGRAQFGKPWAIVPFNGGYAVSDSENNVVRLLSDNKVRTINLTITLANPTGLAVDEKGSLYIADTNNNAIRKVTTNGVVSTWLSGLSEPTGLFYKNGSLYVADSGNHRILKTDAGKITAVVGGNGGGYADGDIQHAFFANPMGIAVDDNGTIYVADTGNSAIRKIQGNTVSTLLCNQGTGTENVPVSPVGLLIKGDSIYLGDVFSKNIIIIPKE